MKDRVINDSTNRITQGYGNGHRGVDLGWRTDESQNRVFSNCQGVVYATLDGIPHGSEKGGGWGNYVLIQHPNGYFSRYAHLQNGIMVKKGQEVNESTQLGIIGNSGRSTARHLHFEVQTSSSSADRINPTPYLSKAIYTPEPPKPSGNETIKYIQTTLNQKYNTGLNVDGYYGPNTKKGLVKGLQHELNVQFKAGLVEDGIFGARTKASCPIVRKGASGNITWLIQAMLYCRGYNTNGIDGIYGDGTFNAVCNFQKNNGLIADGICGKNTFEKLFK